MKPKTLEKIVDPFAGSGSTIDVCKKRGRRDEVAEQKAKAWDMWLDCFTQQAIATEIDVSPATVSGWLSDPQAVGNLIMPPSATDKNPWGSVQHFDVWSFQSAAKDAGSQSYFGALPRWVSTGRGPRGKKVSPRS